MASYLKGKMVNITAPLSLKSRDSFLTKQEEEFYLHIDEIFDTDDAQPDFMDYLNVFCNKRKRRKIKKQSVAKFLTKFRV